MTDFRFSPSWFKRAPCAGLDKVFLSSLPSDRSKAVSICESCSFKDDCLSFALNNNLLVGVWGGKTGPELRRIASEMCSNDGV